VGCKTVVAEVATGTAEDAGAEDTGADDDAGAETEIAVLRVVGLATPPVVRKTPPVGVLEKVSGGPVTGMTLKISLVYWGKDVADELLLCMVDMLVTNVVVGCKRVTEGVCVDRELGVKEEVTYIAGAEVEVAGS
jgi:hypothetical protein